MRKSPYEEVIGVTYNSVCFGNLNFPFWCKSSSERLFKAEFCIRGTVKGGELESLSPLAFQPATTVRVCFSLDPHEYKGLKRGETSDRTHASHAQPRLRLLYIYTQRGACAHTWTQRITFVLRQHVHLKHANNESLKIQRFFFSPAIYNMSR